jgi:hypothetical protein
MGASDGRVVCLTAFFRIMNGVAEAVCSVAASWSYITTIGQGIRH